MEQAQHNTHNTLWGSKSSIDLNHLAQEFTVGLDRELDLLLAPYDIIGSIAHARMLCKVGLLSKNESDTLCYELSKIYLKTTDNTFTIEPEVEDVHSQIELLLTNCLGDIGKKLHTARSRNDQVLLDLKLFFRDELIQIVELASSLASVFLDCANKYKDVLLPGYTHTQIAMPSSFGLWFGAWAEGIADDLSALHSSFRTINRNPLGSAAGFGSSFPIDRNYTTTLLGFEGLNVSSVYAQMGRGKVERIVANALAQLAATLGKFANDVVWFTSTNLGFLKLPDSYTTGSSIMPHKRNPDVFEILRARCNRLKALPNTIELMTTNLLSGYHRDLQLTKELLLPAFHELKACLHICIEVTPQIQVQHGLLEAHDYDNLYTVEAINQLVIAGIPFRDAYNEVSAQVKEGKFKRPVSLQYNHIGSIGNPGLELIQNYLTSQIQIFQFDVIKKTIENLITDASLTHGK